MNTALPNKKATHFPGSVLAELERESDSVWIELTPDRGRSAYGGDTATVVLWCEEINGVIAHNPQCCPEEDEWFISFTGGDTFYQTAPTMSALLADPGVITSLRKRRAMPMAEIPQLHRRLVREDLMEVLRALKQLFLTMFRN